MTGLTNLALEAIIIINYNRLSLKQNLVFFPFYYRTFKLNIVIYNHKPVFIEKELEQVVHASSDTDEYLLNYISSKDIIRVRFKDYKHTNLTILWHGHYWMPLTLLTMSGAIDFFNHFDSMNTWRFKYDIRQQILKPLNLYGVTNIYGSNKAEMVKVLKELIEDIQQGNHQQQMHLNLYDTKYNFNKNRSKFFGISEIAVNDYHHSRYWLNKRLVMFHVQYKKNHKGPYRLTCPNSDYAELVYRRNHHTSLKWHQAGRDFIHHVMANHGYYCVNRH